MMEINVKTLAHLFVANEYNDDYLMQFFSDVCEWSSEFDKKRDKRLELELRLSAHLFVGNQYNEDARNWPTL